MRRVEALLLVSVLALGACGGGDPPSAGTVDAGPEVTVLTHDFPGFHLEPSEEVRWHCQSWTLNNPEPMWVRAVRTRNEGGFHHSNWFVVNRLQFDGPDGSWPCTERGFDEIAAGVNGTVLFAQSTQSASDDQVFGEGAALRLPPFARIVGDVHLLEIAGAALDTHLQMTLEVVPESQVTTPLTPMALTYNALDIPARAQSAFTTECDLDAPHVRETTRPLDARLYYLLPHYHEWGTLFRVEIFGGPRDGEIVFETSSAIGEPLGESFDPPIDLTGATGLRLTCQYDNTTDRDIRYGLAEGEMCMLLAYTDSDLKFVTDVMTNTVVGPDADGVVQNTGPCSVFGVRF